MIKEAYCSYEVSKLLKEKGMNKGYFTYYTQKNNADGTSEAVTTCTHQMAMAWLREVHKLPINIWYDKEEDILDDEVWTSEIAVDRPSYILVGSFASYEEACEAALKYCLENLI